MLYYEDEIDLDGVLPDEVFNERFRCVGVNPDDGTAIYAVREDWAYDEME